ncbi:MAG: FG-GAP-like repeat-containing protein [Candidatus Krumholzibacteriia bacterium]
MLPRHRMPLAAFLMLALLIAATPSSAQPDPWEPGLVQVLFVPEAAIRIELGEPVDLAGNATDGLALILAPLPWHEWSPLCHLPPEELDRLHDDGELQSGLDLYNLNNVVFLRTDPAIDPWLLAADLEALPGVMRSLPVPLPPEPPTPDFEPQQAYLMAAVGTPKGIDAQYAWSQPGGTGAGVTICDVEYSWNRLHQDLPIGAELNTNVYDPFANTDHGTGVAGELVGIDNGWGVTGIAKNAALVTSGAASGTPPFWNPAGAIAAAAAVLGPSDIILLEQQYDITWPTNLGWYVPVEWYGDGSGGQTLNAVYSAIQTATANGIHVVEAGGNGNFDLDTVTWIGDSGAIIVGAGGAQWTNDLQRLSFSSYGSRFDLQGWGELVVTTGYGDLYNLEGQNRWFTSTFNGTSSASPMVTGALACCIGYWLQNVPTALPGPAYFRALLANTGTPQVFGATGNIGPRPNLGAALIQLAAQVPWTDVTPAAATSMVNTTGIAWGDYDRDGDPDLYVTAFLQPNILLRNDLMTGWTPAGPPAVRDSGPGQEPLWCDLDADGNLDLYFANGGAGNRLLRGDGLGNFVDATMPPLQGMGTTWSVAEVDLVGNKANDLYLGNDQSLPNEVLWNDIGMSMWNNVTFPPLDNPPSCWDAAWCDFDRDGDQDVFLANPGNPSYLYEQQVPGGFIDVTPPPLFGMPMPINSAAWGDYDNDGDFDLFVACNGVSSRLFRHDGAGVFTDVTAGALALATAAMGCAWGDYDNDGDLDLFVAQTGPNLLLRNDGPAGFVDDTRGFMADAGSNRGCAWADWDLDGDLDLATADFAGAPRLLRNDWGFPGNWIEIDLVGAPHNTDATGCQVRIVAGGLRQVRQVLVGEGLTAYGPRRLHFGLGTAVQADTLQIWWPSGGVEQHVAVPANMIHQFIQLPVVAVDEDVPGLPAITALHGAAPNPFNPATAIRFDLAAAGAVRLEVFAVDGRRVATLVDANLDAGAHSVRWDGRDGSGRMAASGNYVCRLSAAGATFTSRLMLVK